MSTVDEYLENISSPQKEELERVRDIVKQTIPEAKEVITYGMPGFKYKNKYLMTFGAFNNHMSLFPGSEPIAILKDKLQGFKLSKGTIQFTLGQPVPESVIKELVNININNIDTAK